MSPLIAFTCRTGQQEKNLRFRARFRQNGYGSIIFSLFLTAVCPSLNMKNRFPPPEHRNATSSFGFVDARIQVKKQNAVGTAPPWCRPAAFPEHFRREKRIVR